MVGGELVRLGIVGRRADITHLIVALRGALRWKAVTLLLFAGGLAATWLTFQAVPSSFVPDEDEGYLMAIVQAPAGSSLEHTSSIMEQAEAVISEQDEVLAAFGVAGFSSRALS